ncbi:uncharacterized protein LOC131594977 [Vicia villosa]|uniref:uncharacterized protein LOC131594977 n=1 Tax=Vicia villosa TaxID=3911 RepID=UPI00273AF272|nr:uncharacterized protein LOC131594977 [Vicia villosa]
MASRLRSVLGKLVSDNQSAFIPGRNILDGVLMANEVMDLTKREKRSCMVLKVDFEKAFDCVNWNFLRFILKKICFGERWMKWMEGCVFSSSMSVIINAALMRKEKEMGDYQGFKINEAEDVSLLQFADDTLIVVDGSSSNLWCVKSILRGFEMMSGLKINFHKSKLYGINVGEWLLNAASDFLSYNIDSLPFKFLRVKIGDSPRKILMRRELLDSLRKRLATWKGRHL